MAHVYVCAGLTKNPVLFSNMAKVWVYLNKNAAGCQIYHGTTAMDAFRLRKVKNYAAFRTALHLNDFRAVPFFWEHSAGVSSMTVTREKIE